MNNNLKNKIIATRPWSFPASAMPAIVVLSYLFYLNRMSETGLSLNWLNGVLSVIGVVVFQASGNLISDYFDHKYRVDTEDSFGSSRMLVDGIFEPKFIYRFGMELLVIGSLLGLYLTVRSNINLLWIGLIGVLSTYFYYKLKYIALGDILIFIIYGQLIALGTAVVSTGEMLFGVLPISATVGFLVVNILHANNTRDIYFDSKVPIKTMAMLGGIRFSKIKFAVLSILSYMGIVILVIIKMLHPMCLLVFVTMPLMIKNIKLMNRAEIASPEIIKDLDGYSAKLVMMFSLVLSVANVIASFL